MNKLTIISKTPQTYFIKRLVEEATFTKVSLFNPWENSEYRRDKDEVVLVRSTSIHASAKDLELIEQQQLQTIPSLFALKTLRTKPLQFSYFKQLAIPHLPWLDLESCQPQEIIRFAQQRKLLIKPKRGQGGWGIQVFENTSQLLTWWEQARDREFMLQHYLQDHQEFRVFFIGEQSFCLKRIKKGITANFKQEGEAEQVCLIPPLQAIVDKIRKDLALAYGAADFLVAQDQYYLLEMNLVPGIEQLEAVTGENIALKLLEKFTQP